MNATNIITTTESELAHKLMFSMLSEMEKDTSVTEDNIEDVIDMAVSLTKISLREARKLNNKEQRQIGLESIYEASKKYEKKHKTRKRSSNLGKFRDTDTKLKKAGLLADRMFHAFLLTENFLSKKEDREINKKHISNMAKRIVKAAFKDIEGIDLSHVDMDFDENNINFIIPKTNE